MSYSHPVYVHVYGSPINRYLRRLGFSFCLSSVEVHGMEHMFQPHGMYIYHPYEHAGQIQSLVGHERIDSILIGHTGLDIGDTFDHIAELENVFTAASYHPITNNSHHFADRLCRDLTDNGIPPWLNRFTALGPLFNPEIVPVLIMITMMVITTAGANRNR